MWVSDLYRTFAFEETEQDKVASTMNYLIADSGSTKTSWLFVDHEGQHQTLESLGTNPVRDSAEQLSLSLPQRGEGTDTLVLHDNKGSEHRLRLNGRKELKVRFYGAGCIPPYSDTLKRLLEQRLPEADICVESDLLGAAHALLGHDEGIACILGTGSNSCLYDGKSIVENVSPLGYILGDEGSGAVLGKHLVGDLLKGQMSEQLCQLFLEETGLTRTDIINKVYREPMPNRFLASLVPFLGRHREEEDIHCFLVKNFRSFFRRNVALYRRPDLPVSFVGGVAYSYRNELAEAASLEGFFLGKILLRPIEAIGEFLLSEANQ